MRSVADGAHMTKSGVDTAVEMLVHRVCSRLSGAAASLPVIQGDETGTENSGEDLRAGSGYISFEGNESAMRDSADTIFAQATPPGRSAVAVIRISGPRAFDVPAAFG